MSYLNSEIIQSNQLVLRLLGNRDLLTNEPINKLKHHKMNCHSSLALTQSPLVISH